MEEERNTDNVFILGAGFSYNANIPLLNSFIERMLEYNLRKKNGGNKISINDLDIIEKALKIRSELDGYHGRVTFNDRNIEDLLSMLSFNVLGGGRTDKTKLDRFVNAIAKTIEISCELYHPGVSNNSYRINNSGSDIYRSFWISLFNWISHDNLMPSIITLNYDLVLERSLLQVLMNTIYNNRDSPKPFNTFSVEYYYNYFETDIYELLYQQYTKNNIHEYQYGTIVKSAENESDQHLDIDLLKLHGSLNFPKSKKDQNNLKLSLVKAIDNPYMIPPVTNKNTNGGCEEIWKVSLNRLRKAKNIIFVGYSLPITDAYMQFFLKAALGPNQDLNNIYVYDPILFTNNEYSEKMKKRFEDCFSPQVRSRICFTPPYYYEDTKGTTSSFIDTLSNDPERILF